MYRAGAGGAVGASGSNRSGYATRWGATNRRGAAQNFRSLSVPPHPARIAAPRSIKRPVSCTETVQKLCRKNGIEMAGPAEATEKLSPLSSLLFALLKHFAQDSYRLHGVDAVEVVAEVGKQGVQEIDSLLTIQRDCVQLRDGGLHHPIQEGRLVGL